MLSSSDFLIYVILPLFLFSDVKHMIMGRQDNNTGSIVHLLFFFLRPTIIMLNI